MRTTSARSILLLSATALLPALGYAQVKAVRAARFFTMAGDPVRNGVMLLEKGKIVAIGADVAVPEGAEVLDFGAATVTPGFVDLHHHVSGSMGDINDMVHPTNPELRTLDVVRPSEKMIRIACAGGVTTTLFIPGSGTNLSGFGVLLKMHAGRKLVDMVIRELGAMKVAQGYNPERRVGDLGNSRMGSHQLLTETLMRGKRYAAAWRAFRDGKGPKPRKEPDLEQLRRVFDLEVPVIIHTAGARDCVATARMFQDVFQVRMVLSHGTFDGHWAASALAARHTPVNLGPRMYDFTKDGRFQGIAEGYYRVGCTDLSINTDAPVIPAEQLQLQAAMAVRLGLPWRAALEALTIVPARQIGIADRVGSLEKGKDADFFVCAGDPLDPRHPPQQVFIDGRLVYRAGDPK
ncbi:MAG: amidohydrolase family protein [Planctomycetes bacterium]|nr:amidohydrolase family protein [Planctomycetota bacterium]